MTHFFDVHPRTPEAKAKCRNPGSCHDCAMTCKYGNLVHDEHNRLFPCGTDVFNKAGNIIVCGDCALDQAQDRDNRG